MGFLVAVVTGDRLVCDGCVHQTTNLGEIMGNINKRVIRSVKKARKGLYNAIFRDQCASSNLAVYYPPPFRAYFWLRPQYTSGTDSTHFSLRRL